MKETKLICPCCGAEFKIAEKEHVCMGVALGEDSNAGTVEMPLKKEGNTKTASAQERLALLKAAGIDTTGLFALKGAAGEDLVIKMTDGKPSLVPDDDPIFASIMASDTIPEHRLYRRWVMAQMYRLLTHRSKSIRKRGSHYMWNMTLEEYRVQAILFKNDPEAFAERRMWFSGTLPKKMIRWYLQRFEAEYINYEAIDYFRTPYYSAFMKMQKISKRIGGVKSPDKLYELFKEFNDIRRSLKLKQKAICPVWYGCYLAAGAYFTLKNLALFHGLKYHGSTGEEAVAKIMEKSQYFAERGESHKMYSVFLRILADNKIDKDAMEAKRHEWYENKKNRQAPAIEDARPVKKSRTRI